MAYLIVPDISGSDVLHVSKLGKYVPVREARIMSAPVHFLVDMKICIRHDLTGPCYC